MAAPLSSSPRSPTSWAPSLIRLPRDARGLRGEGRGGRSGRISLEGWRRRLALIGDFGGFWQNADWKHSFLSLLPQEYSEVQESLPKFQEYSEVEGSFGGLFGLNFRLIIFSVLVSLKKGGFRINDLILIICTIILVISQVVIFSLHATVVGSLSPNFVGFGFKAWGLQDMWHRLLIFQISLKDKQDCGLMGPSA
jgi:hypothetical protein